MLLIKKNVTLNNIAFDLHWYSKGRTQLRLPSSFITRVIKLSPINIILHNINGLLTSLRQPVVLPQNHGESSDLERILFLAFFLPKWHRFSMSPLGFLWCCQHILTQSWKHLFNLHFTHCLNSLTVVERVRNKKQKKKKEKKKVEEVEGCEECSSRSLNRKWS